MPEPAKKDPTPTQATGDMAARLAVETSARQALETRLTAAEATNKKLTEDTRRKRFTDIVKGRSDENAVPWGGSDVTEQVSFLMELSEKFGEDSEQVNKYIVRENANAKRLAESGLFTETGTSRTDTATDATAKLTQMAAQRASEKKIDIGEAMSQVAKENPQLYAAHQAASYANKGQS